MTTPSIRSRSGYRRGGVLLELIVALALLATVLLPLAGGFIGQRRVAKQLSQRLVMTELIDGEMEFIAAGRWQRFPEGTNEIAIELPHGFVAPAGRSHLIRTGGSFRLVWEPETKTVPGRIERQWTNPSRNP